MPRASLAGAQLTAMLFCQMAQADSLREICNGLACCLGKLVHLGITRKPTKSNLSYANAHRPAAIFEDLFWAMTDRFCQFPESFPRYFQNHSPVEVVIFSQSFPTFSPVFS